MTEYAYFEGNYVPVEDAKVSVKTHAFLYGTAIFEGIRAYWLPETSEIAIFKLDEHLERLKQNSKVCYMTTELTPDDMRKICIELIEKNAPTTDSYLRPTLFKTGVNITPSLTKTVTDLTVWTNALGQYVDTTKGLKVCVSSWRRLEDTMIPPRAKANGAYMNTALAVTEARSRGYDDAIVLTHSGHVSEGSAMNIFLVRNGKLITPAVTENILEGITRATLIELAKNEFGIETEERTVNRTELYVADEAFFCGTGAQVAPITEIDERPVGTGKTGPITQKLQALYFDVVRNKVPKYSHWCTLVKIKQAAATA